MFSLHIRGIVLVKSTCLSQAIFCVIQICHPWPISMVITRDSWGFGPLPRVKAAVEHNNLKLIPQLDSEV